VTTRQQERDSESVRERDRLSARIATSVLLALGKPDDLRAVHVRRLWGETYRVNVLTGAETNSATIAHSYFLVADDNGSILEASPAISKHY
jgi:hypothetical protein